MTDQEFNALVDEEFSEPESVSRHRGGGRAAWVPPDSLINELEAEGADPRLSRGAARFAGALGRCFGHREKQPLSDESVKFLNGFNKAAREAASVAGIKLRND